jgi:hypothetical protein
MAIASNESFSKAHMFTATCVRRSRRFTCSAPVAGCCRCGVSGQSAWGSSARRQWWLAIGTVPTVGQVGLFFSRFPATPLEGAPGWAGETKGRHRREAADRQLAAMGVGAHSGCRFRPQFK